MISKRKRKMLRKMNKDFKYKQKVLGKKHKQRNNLIKRGLIHKNEAC